jgi:hypothetical protein
MKYGETKPYFMESHNVPAAAVASEQLLEASSFWR